MTIWRQVPASGKLWFASRTEDGYWLFLSIGRYARAAVIFAGSVETARPMTNQEKADAMVRYTELTEQLVGGFGEFAESFCFGDVRGLDYSTLLDACDFPEDAGEIRKAMEGM